MGLYILMTKVAPEVTGDIKHREALGKSWKQKVDEKCKDVKWVSHYALLGPYDFMDIYEADSDETATKVSLITRANGALIAESWPAMDWKRFIELNKEIE